MLRQAKEESEEKALKVGPGESLSPMICYSTEFDQYQGLAHLEALEILSRQSSIKVCVGSHSGILLIFLDKKKV